MPVYLYVIAHYLTIRLLTDPKRKSDKTYHGCPRNSGIPHLSEYSYLRITRRVHLPPTLRGTEP